MLKHNGYKLDGFDRVLPGVTEYLQGLPGEDKIILLTSRTEEYRQMTLDFLNKSGIQYDAILFEMPMGESILVNDRKTSGLDMVVTFNVDRNCFEMPQIIRKK